MKIGKQNSGLGEWKGKKRIAVEKHIGGEVSEVSILNLEEEKEIKGVGDLRRSSHCRLVGVGTSLYAMGIKSVNNLVADAATTDLSLSPKWKPCEPLPRAGPAAFVSLGSKIFAFGGLACTLAFAEFYDTDAPSKGWRQVPAPPIDHGFVLPYHILSDPQHDRLICIAHFDDLLLAYYPSYLDRDESPWVTLPSDPVWLRCCLCPATSPVDNVIYTFSEYQEDCITAYDISTQQDLSVSWTTETPFSPHILSRHHYYIMLYLGENIICYVSRTISIDPSRQGYQTYLHFFRFQVCRVSDKEATLTPLAIHTIHVEGRFRPGNYVAL